MPAIKTTMDAFKLLDKSNCRACNEKTCLAFAAAVFQGKKPLSDCPKLDKDVLEAYGGDIEKPRTMADEQEEALEALKQMVGNTDLASAAERTGGRYTGDRLTLKVFGKDFSVDKNGRLYSDIHINPWVAAPLLNYILNCSGIPVKGEWVPFRELENGRAMHGLFNQRCEKPLKKVADAYPQLFEDLMDIFNGKAVDSHQDADIALSLYPLPKVPMLICYWQPEDGIESGLQLFFDVTAEQNCGIEGIYALGTGLVQMFEKLAQRHG
ncbi:MAG: DUF3786 domain-containing protein [Thermodesulfobacteriota bacterium]|nr:DUF3786 domain-containing protein [Thermodesulfobacteriota bacterium]